MSATRAATAPQNERKTNVIISSTNRKTGRSPVGMGANGSGGAGLLRENVVAPIDKSEFKSFFVPNEFSPVTCIDTGRSGRVVFSGYESKGLRAWDILSPNDESSRTPLQTLKPHVDKLTCIGVSPDGETLATGGWDKQLKIYQVNKLDDLNLNTSADIAQSVNNVDIEGGIVANGGHIEDEDNDEVIINASSPYNTVSQSDMDESRRKNSNMSGSGNPNLDKIRQELDSRKLKKQFTMVQEDDEDDLNEEEEEGGLVENGEVTTNEGNAVEIQKPQLVSEVEMVDKD